MVVVAGSVIREAAANAEGVAQLMHEIADGALDQSHGVGVKFCGLA